ncbi:MAG TPA: polysaccharide deacetylase family protein [Blastocatellia bacterium]|jgi:chitin deacetylase|nr:polysaccharide deacetylase family protein [Blastocatellia bacterium]
MINKRAKAILAIVVAVIAVTAAAFQISKSRTFQFFGEIIPRINTREKIVALTFDDGPTPGVTEEVLSTLNEEGVKATFFVIGSELERNLEEGRKIVAAGHELGNHTYSHERMVLKTPSFIESEIERTDQLIRQAGYQSAIHFRPPFGKKLILLPYYLSRTSRKTIMWDVEPDSYPEVAADSNKIVAHVIEKVRPGSIILLHVMYKSRGESLKAVRGVITGLKGEGYSFKTVSQMLDTVGTQASLPGSDK